MSVTSLASGRLGNCSAFSAMITLPPQLSVANNSNTERSKQMEVEAKTPANTSGVNTSRAQCKSVTALWCSIATPLGRPVEPEVKMT